MKKLMLVITIFVLIFSFCACDSKNEDEIYDNSFYEEFPTGDEVVTIEIEKNPQAEITLTDGSTIIIELRYDIAPNAVANFIAFADEKIYDKMAFTDVRRNCIVMTDTLESEFVPPYYVMDELDNGSDSLSHIRGTVSMIRETSSDSLTGQFFILTEDQKHFDATFTAFGTVIEGMENLDKIAASEVDEKGNLVAPVEIEKVKVRTYGEKFPLPTIIRK